MTNTTATNSAAYLNKIPFKSILKSTSVSVVYDANTNTLKLFDLGSGKFFELKNASQYSSITFADNVTYNLVLGDETGNILAASTGLDIILAGGSADRIRANAGDIVDGGAGSDAVFVAGKFREFKIEHLANGATRLTRTVNGKAEKPIILQNIEQIHFDDVIEKLGNATSNTFISIVEKKVSTHAMRSAVANAELAKKFDIVDGGAGTDTVIIKTYNGDLGNFSFALNARGEILVTEHDTGSQELLIGIENVTLREGSIVDEGAQIDSTYAIVKGTNKADILKSTTAAIVLSGDGDDVVTITEGYLDLGNGNDIGISTDDSTYVVGGLGNDSYSIKSLNALDYKENSAIQSVDVSLTQKGATGLSISGTVTKYGVASPVFGVTKPIGVDRILGGTDEGLRILTGSGNDRISLEGLEYSYIDAGAGNNTISLSNTIEIDGAPLSVRSLTDYRNYRANNNVIELGTGHNTLSFTNAYAKLDYTDQLKGVYIDIAKHKTYDSASKTNVIDAWSLDSQTHLSFSVSNNLVADTVSGSDGIDIVHVGLNDKAELLGGDDYISDEGGASVDGGAGIDTLAFSIPTQWLNDETLDKSQHNLSFLIDANSGYALWTDANSEGRAINSQRSEFSNIETFDLAILRPDPFNFDSVKFIGSDQSERVIFTTMDSGTRIEIAGGGGNDIFEIDNVAGQRSSPEIYLTDFDQTAGEADKIDLANLIPQYDDRYKNIVLTLQNNRATIDLSDGTCLKLRATNDHKFVQEDFIGVGSNVKFRIA